MKRLQAAMARVVTKTKTASLSPDASATIVAVCKVASTISVPGVQIACTAIVEFITMMETANANDRNWKALLSVIDSCAKRVTEFAESISTGQSSEYIVNSTDKRATIAREAIVEFEKTISSTKDKVEVRLKNGKLRKTLGATAVQGEIQECRQALTDALKDLDGRILNILCLPSVEISIVSKAKSDAFDIPGARAVLNEDIEILDDIDFAARFQETFWQSLVKVDHGKSVRVAKLYSPTEDSKQKFLEDMKWFSEKICCPKTARIYGYNADSQTPFIVLTISSVQPLMERLVQISRTDHQNFWMAGWRLFQDLHKAGSFLFSGSTDVRGEYSRIQRSLGDPATGQSGQLVVAPAENSTRMSYTAQKDLAAHAIQQVWSDYLLVQTEEQHNRHLRPFLLALATDPEAFLKYPINGLKSSVQVSEAIFKFWPPVGERFFQAMSRHFPSDVMVGDVGILKVAETGENIGEIEFRRLGNLVDLAGVVEFRPPGAPTDSPNIYRKDIYGMTEEPWQTITLQVDWWYRINGQEVQLPALAKQFKTLGEQYGVPPSSLAIVLTASYMLKSKRPQAMRELLEAGRPIHLYTSFSPENQYQGAKWSFHESPPTESESADEATMLSAFNCTEILGQETRGSVRYLQLEDEDIAFYLKESANEGETDHAVITGESSD